MIKEILFLMLFSAAANAIEVGDIVSVSRSQIECKDIVRTPSCRFCDSKDFEAFNPAVAIKVHGPFGPVSQLSGEEWYKTCSELESSWPSDGNVRIEIIKMTEELWNSKKEIHIEIEAWLGSVGLKGEAEVKAKFRSATL